MHNHLWLINLAKISGGKFYHWWHSSLVRMSVFGQWTFYPAPCLWLTADQFVGKLSAMCQHLHWLWRWRPLKRQTRAIWMQAKVCEFGLGLRPRPNSGPVFDAQRHWGSLQHWTSDPHLYVCTDHGADSRATTADSRKKRSRQSDAAALDSVSSDERK